MYMFSGSPAMTRAARQQLCRHVFGWFPPICSWRHKCRLCSEDTVQLWFFSVELSCMPVDPNGWYCESPKKSGWPVRYFGKNGNTDSNPDPFHFITSMQMAWQSVCTCVGTSITQRVCLGCFENRNQFHSILTDTCRCWAVILSNIAQTAVTSPQKLFIQWYTRKM